MSNKRRHRRSDTSSDEDDEPEGNVDNNMIRLMEGSGQTKQERQILRQQQRRLHDEIVGLPDDNLVELNQYRIKNNDLWKQVRFMKENTLDSKNVELIADKSAVQAEKMVTVSIRLSNILVSLFMRVVWTHLMHFCP